MTKDEEQQKLIAMLRKEDFEGATLVAHYATLVAHYAGELKRLQERNAALADSLQEFLYRVSWVVPFDEAEWVRDLGEEILKQLKEGPK